MSKFETIVIGMGMGSDPEHSFRLHSRYIPAKGGLGRNSIAYESPEVDRLLDAGVRDLDREKRKKAYFRLQEVLADEVPYLPVYHFVNIRGTRKGIEASGRTRTCRSTRGTPTSGGSGRREAMGD